MRTTVTLDEDVERLLRDEMQRARLSFKECLNRAVRQGMEAGKPALPPFVVKPWNLGLLPGIDPARLNQLADELETEALVEAMRRAEGAVSKARAKRGGARPVR